MIIKWLVTVEYDPRPGTCSYHPRPETIAHEPHYHADTLSHAVTGREPFICRFLVATFLPILVSVHQFDGIPSHSSDDQGKEGSKHKIDHGLSVPIQLLEIHSKDRCGEIEWYVDKG